MSKMKQMCQYCGRDIHDKLSGHPFSDCIYPYVKSETLQNKMNIQITIEGADGLDARQQILDFLGQGQLSAKVSGTDLQFKLDRDKGNTPSEEAAPEPIEPVTPEFQNTVNEEQPKTRKRRTQAEIAAEKATLEANTGTEEPPASTENVEVSETTQETSPTEEKVEQGITAEMLTQKAVDLGRAGKRDAVLAVLTNDFGGATIAKKDGKPQLQPEQYQAVMDAFNAIG